MSVKEKAMMVVQKVRLRGMRSMVSGAIVGAALSVSAFAADPAAFDLTATMTTAVTKIVGDTLGMVSAVVPTVATLLAASIGIAYGFRFIRNLFAKT